MRADLLNYIRELTAQDKKVLSQKALKLVEEVGELAKAALPYDNAFGTNHRFVTPNKILEESVDTILVALSIVYSLGFSDDEIANEMKRKSDYWAELQAREDRMTERTPYEIHVTVKEAPNVEAFRQACAGLEVKPIVLDLQTQSSGVIKDVMTSSVFFGKNSEAYAEQERIADGLRTAGFEVVRRKIETVPWHPAAPSRENSNPVMPAHCYFECHFSVVVRDDSQRVLLEALARQVDCHLSRNVFKRHTDGSFTMMMTYRTYEGVYEDVKATVESINQLLTAHSFDIGKSIIEFSIFDTKVTHDATWLAH